jgi:hypothetical protein
MTTDKQWEKSILFWDNEMLAEFDRSKMTIKDFRELKLRDSSNLSDNQDKIKELESLIEYYQAEFNANQDKVYTVTDNSNVACLSLNDIKWWIEKYFDYPGGISIEKLKQLVSEKLKQKP